MYIIIYDFGTSSVKTCLFQIDSQIHLVAGASAEYGLYISDNGGAEQDAEEWWQAMRTTTARVLEESGRRPSEIAGISFCSQMQGLVLVDRDGVPVHRPMSYMDQRAPEEIRKGIAYGPQIAGAKVWKLFQSLRNTGAVSSSVKDPLWKYKWVQKNEPELFRQAYKWLDVKEYLICRCTGEFVMTRDSAYSTFLYDTRKGHEGWSHTLCSMYGVEEKHIPALIECTDVAGTLTERAAAELGANASQRFENNIAALRLRAHGEAEDVYYEVGRPKTMLRARR